LSSFLLFNSTTTLMPPFFRPGGREPDSAAPAAIQPGTQAHPRNAIPESQNHTERVSGLYLCLPKYASCNISLQFFCPCLGNFQYFPVSQKYLKIFRPISVFFLHFSCIYRFFSPSSFSAKFTWLISEDVFYKYVKQRHRCSVM